MEKLKLKHRVPPAAVLLADSHSDLGAITDRNKQKALFHQYNFFLGPSPCQQSDCLIPTQDKYCLKNTCVSLLLLLHCSEFNQCGIK